MAFCLNYGFWATSLITTLMVYISIITSSDCLYLFMKYSTWAIDYLYIGATIYYLDQYLSDHLTPEVIFKHQVLNSALVCIVDMLKAFLFFSLLSGTKIEHLNILFRDLGTALFTLAECKENFAFLGQISCGQGIISDF